MTGSWANFLRNGLTPFTGSAAVHSLSGPGSERGLPQWISNGCWCAGSPWWRCCAFIVGAALALLPDSAQREAPERRACRSDQSAAQPAAVHASSARLISTSAFPDWDLVAGLSLQAGTSCVELRGATAPQQLRRSSCAGLDNQCSQGRPQWFPVDLRFADRRAADRHPALFSFTTSRACPRWVVEYDLQSYRGNTHGHPFSPLLGFSATLVAVSLPRHVLRDQPSARANAGNSSTA